METENDKVMLEGQIELAISTIKHVIIINGGAAIAILTFLGHFLSKGSSQVNSIDIPKLTNSLTYFGAGVAVGTLASAFAYIFQAFEREGPAYTVCITIFRFFAVCCVLGSIGFFMYGLFSAQRSFSPNSASRLLFDLKNSTRNNNFSPIR